MTVAANVARAPISDAWTTAPGRMRYMYRPTNRAVGMVQAMVSVPQELPGTTWTQPAGSVTVDGPTAISWNGKPSRRGGSPSPRLTWGHVWEGRRTLNPSGRVAAGLSGA